MTQSKHTPGPWVYNDPTEFKQVGGPFSNTAVYAQGNAFPWRMAEIQAPDHDTEVANARLIASAPDLLAALREASDLLAERTYGNPARSPGHNARIVMEAAIAKAEG